MCVAIDPCLAQDAGGCHSNAECRYIGPGQVILLIDYYYYGHMMCTLMEDILCVLLGINFYEYASFVWNLTVKFKCIFYCTEHLCVQARLHWKWFNM